jgi:hypothetical protein
MINNNQAPTLSSPLEKKHRIKAYKNNPNNWEE